MTEFPHLFPGAGRIAALSAEERILRITSGIFSIMTQLAIAAIESGEERILSRDVLRGDSLRVVLGEPV